MKSVKGDSVKPWPQLYLASMGLSETYIHQSNKKILGTIKLEGLYQSASPTSYIAQATTLL